MSSADIDEIYEELLKIYKVKYPSNPKHVLSYKISELMGEGRTREGAVLTLYEKEGKITRTEARELEKAVRKKREEAIEQQIMENKKSVEKLTLLFSKGELNEESYEAAIKPLEEKIAKLEIEKKEEEIKSLEKRLTALKTEATEEETVKPRRGLAELPAPPPTAPTKRLDFKTISKYFIHGFAFSVIMIALFFVWVVITVFLAVVGSFIGLILGFVVLLFMLSGLNCFLTENIWSISTKTEWMSLLGHGFVLFFALIIANIPSIIVGLTAPNLAVTMVLFVVEAFIDGFVAKNVAVFWEEDEY
jgi:hypothetical protein